MNSKALHLGLFVLRFGIGVVFIMYGFPKLSDGPDRWADMGQAVMEPLGVEFGYAVWGFLSAAAQAIGGLFLALGLMVRPAAVCLLSGIRARDLGCPVLVFASRRDAERRKRTALGLGAQGYCFRFQELYQAIERVLAPGDETG